MRIVLFSNKILTQLSTWIVILSCFSYPVTAVLILQLQLPGTIVNTFLKAGYAVLYFLLIFMAIGRGNFQLLQKPTPLFVFFALYSIRLLVDINIRGVVFYGGDSFYVYSYFFGATFLPCVSIMVSRKYLSFVHMNKYVFYTLLVANLLVLWYIGSKGGGAIAEQFSVRNDITNDDNNAVINAILISFTGALLVLFSVANLLFIKIQKKYFALILLSGIVIGFINVLLGASRGPFLSLLLLLLFLFFIYIYNSKKNTINLIKISSSILVLVIFFILYIQPLITSGDLNIIIRIVSFIEDRASNTEEYRDIAFKSAINDFWDSPIIGKQFVGTFDNYYPHNSVIEALMATGLIGFFFYFS